MKTRYKVLWLIIILCVLSGIATNRHPTATVTMVGFYLVPWLVVSLFFPQRGETTSVFLASEAVLILLAVLSRAL